MWLKQRLSVFLLVLFFVPCYGFGEVLLTDEDAQAIQTELTNAQAEIESLQNENYELLMTYENTLKMLEQTFNDSLAWQSEAERIQIDYEKLQQSVSEQLNDYQTCKEDSINAKKALAECQKSYQKLVIKNDVLSVAVVVCAIALVLDTSFFLVKLNQLNE